MCMPSTPAMPALPRKPNASPSPPIEPTLPPPPPEQAKQVAPTIKASASQKQDANQVKAGVSSLTIPLNTGAKNQKSGLNIPT